MLMLRYLEDSEDLKVGVTDFERTVGNIGGSRWFHQENGPAGNERERPKDF